MVNKRSPRKIFNQRGAVRMIYVTGDCHADFTKFNTKIFPEQYEMTKDDLIITGNIESVDFEKYE
mgnify:CR=1 FL=1